MSFKVGNIVAKLTLDTKEWDESIEKVKKDVKILGKLAKKYNINMTLSINISKPNEK